MAEDSTDTSTDAPDTTTDTPDTETEAWEPPTREEWEKLSKTAEARKRERSEYAKRVRELEAQASGKDTDKSEPDPADTLRTALRRTAATSVLVERGITDKAQQEAVLSVMHLDTLDVGEDGSVDTDTLADTLDTLSRIFGKSDKPRPPKVDTRKGQGDSGSGKDPDSQRYERIMGRR